MKTFLTVFLFLSSSVLYAQKQSVVVKFDPLALIDDVSFPTVQAGAEIKLSNNIGWYNEIGIKYRKSIEETSDSPMVGSNGFKLKTEFRYYPEIFKHSPFEGTYFAVNAFYTHDSHNTKLAYFYEHDSSLLMHDVYGIKKNVYGFNIVYGNQKKLGDHFLLDLYAGLGFRFINYQTNNLEYTPGRDDLATPVDLNFPTLRKDAETSSNNFTNSLNITAGVRICYQF